MHAALVTLDMEIMLEHVHNVLLELTNQVPLVIIVELDNILVLEQPVVHVKIIIS